MLSYRAAAFIADRLPSDKAEMERTIDAARGFTAEAIPMFAGEAVRGVALAEVIAGLALAAFAAGESFGRSA